MNIVITGGRGGIGSALIKYLQPQGNKIISISRTAHPSCGYFVADVAFARQVEAAADFVNQQMGYVDVLIQCAAIQAPINYSMSVSPAMWEHNIRVNLCGAFNVIHAFYPLLMRHQIKRAKVLCFSGGGASKGRARLSAYACAKTGIVRLVETLADEWENDSIDILALAPGSTRTQMQEELIKVGENVAGMDETVAARKTTDRSEEICEFVDHLIHHSDGLTGRLISCEWDKWRNMPWSEIIGDCVFKLRRTV